MQAAHPPEPDRFSNEFEAAFGRLQVQIERTCLTERGLAWSAQVAAAIRVGFEFAAANSDAASVLTRDALAAGPDGIARYQRLLAYIAGKLAPGRRAGHHGAELPQLTEQALAGGLLSLVAERLDHGRLEELPSLAPQAIQFVLTPYFGADEASRIATFD